jgi:hypothetical protein
VYVEGPVGMNFVNVLGRHIFGRFSAMKIGNLPQMCCNVEKSLMDADI